MVLVPAIVSLAAVSALSLGAASFPDRASAAAAPTDTSSWQRVLPTGGPPFPRAGHSAIYDPVRHRMIVFGGFGGVYLRDVWALSLEGAPTWTELAPTGVPPQARSGHSAIYDPVRDRMVVFGGTDGSFNGYKSDVWALSLSGTPAWTQISPAGDPISVRGGHSAIYDPVRDRMVVFGGTDGFYSNGEVWSLSLSGTPTWRILAPSSAAPNYLESHQAVYDPVHDAMVVFGGADLSHLLHNDTWSFSLSPSAMWSQILPLGPLPDARAEHAMVYDSRQDRILMYGGSAAGLALSDAWVLYPSNPARWIESIEVGAAPPVRSSHSGIFFPDSARMVVFGGGGGASNSNDTWASDWCSSCAPVPPAEVPPSLRLEHAGLNPFGAEAALSMGLVRDGPVRVQVFDFAGRLVATLDDRSERAGWHALTWGGRDARGARVPSGVYLVRLESGGETRVRKVVMSR